MPQRKYASSTVQFGGDELVQERLLGLMAAVSGHRAAVAIHVSCREPATGGIATFASAEVERPVRRSAAGRNPDVRYDAQASIAGRRPQGESARAHGEADGRCGQRV